MGHVMSDGDRSLMEAINDLPSMGDGLCRDILDLAWTSRLDLAPVGALVRDSRKGTWELTHDPVVGALACSEAARRLAPQEPEPDDTDGDGPEVDFFSAEGIARHNASVAAFAKPIKLAAEAMALETCEACVRFMSTPGTAANVLGAVLRGRIGADWEPSSDVGAGILVYGIVLKRLDRFDADFRPRPEPVEVIRSGTSDGSGISLVVRHLPASGEFEVVVERAGASLSERFPALRRPTYGMEVSDHAHAMAIAERLAERIEADGGASRGT